MMFLFNVFVLVGLFAANVAFHLAKQPEPPVVEPRKHRTMTMFYVNLDQFQHPDRIEKKLTHFTHKHQSEFDEIIKSEEQVERYGE